MCSNVQSTKKNPQFYSIVMLKKQACFTVYISNLLKTWRHFQVLVSAKEKLWSHTNTVKQGACHEPPVLKTGSLHCEQDPCNESRFCLHENVDTKNTYFHYRDRVGSVQFWEPILKPDFCLGYCTPCTHNSYGPRQGWDACSLNSAWFMCHSYICTLWATYTVQCVQGGEVENKLCDRVEGSPSPLYTLLAF